MPLSKKTLVKIAICYGFLVFVANSLTIFCSHVCVFHEGNTFHDYLMAFRHKNFFIEPVKFFMTFFIPTALSIFYVLSAKKDDREEIKRRLINLPVAYSLISASGWIFACLYNMAEFLYIKQTYNVISIEMIFSELIFTVLKIILVFAICYFSLENINRNFVLPRYFRKGNISRQKGIICPSITVTFTVLYFTISVFPITYFAYLLETLEIKHNIKIDVHVFFITLIFLITFFLLTLRVAMLFKKPLSELIKKAKKIEAGDYKIYDNTIVSSDEFGMLSDSFNDMSQALQEKEFMRDTFGKLVDPHVRDYLLRQSIKLGGHKRCATIMFCDIRNFTKMSENMPPEKVVFLLNRYFTALGTCITKNNGIINKYIGDAIMAIFGAPVDSKTHSADAIKAALQMRQELAKLNSEAASKNLPILNFGIGIHSGTLLAGNIGAKDRMEYTVIGDTVNTASRIESLCKQYGKNLLISAAALDLLNTENDGKKTANFDFSFVDEAEIRGKEEKVKLYTIEDFQ